MRLINRLYQVTPYPARTPEHRRSEIIGAVVFLAGEWVPAWLWMSIAFLVATLGVVGLGWYVLRGDALNRAAEEAPGSETSQHH
jgi:hypothetical protein